MKENSDNVVELLDYKIKKRENNRKFIGALIEEGIFEAEDLSWSAKGVLAYLYATRNTPLCNFELWNLCGNEKRVKELKLAMIELALKDYIDISGI